MNFGDAIASVATPLARVFGLPCVDPVTQQLWPESGCNKMRLNLNAGMSLADAFYDRFWKSSNTNNEGNTMQYIVTKTQSEQIVIDANDPKEAIAKVKNGEGTLTTNSENCSAVPRPMPPGSPK